MIPLSAAIQLQLLVTAAYTAKIFLFDDSLENGPPGSLINSLHVWGLGLLFFFNCCDLLAASRFTSTEAQRKFLQFYSLGYVATIGVTVHENLVESHQPVLIVCSLLLVFNLINIYVWHKDAKGGYFEADNKMSCGLKAFFIFMLFDAVSCWTGFGLTFLRDPSAGDNPEVLTRVRLLCGPLIASSAASFATSIVDGEDQKKALQYKLIAILFSVGKISHGKFDISEDASLAGLIGLSSAASWIIYLIYGGTLEQSVLRMYYFFELMFAMVGVTNTSLSVKMVKLDMSESVALYMAILFAHMGILTCAVTQMEHSSHVTFLKYHVIHSLTAAGVCFTQRQEEFFFFNFCMMLACATFQGLVVWREEIGWDKFIPELPCCSDAGGAPRAAYATRGRAPASASKVSSNKSSSPKRRGGRSSTPSGRKKHA